MSAYLQNKRLVRLTFEHDCLAIQNKTMRVAITAVSARNKALEEALAAAESEVAFLRGGVGLHIVEDVIAGRYRPPDYDA